MSWISIILVSSILGSLVQGKSDVSQHFRPLDTLDHHGRHINHNAGGNIHQIKHYSHAAQRFPVINNLLVSSVARDKNIIYPERHPIFSLGPTIHEEGIHTAIGHNHDFEHEVSHSLIPPNEIVYPTRIIYPLDHNHRVINPVDQSQGIIYPLSNDHIFPSQANMQRLTNHIQSGPRSVNPFHLGPGPFSLIGNRKDNMHPFPHIQHLPYNDEHIPIHEHKVNHQVSALDINELHSHHSNRIFHSSNPSVIRNPFIYHDNINIHDNTHLISPLHNNLAHEREHVGNHIHDVYEDASTNGLRLRGLVRPIRHTAPMAVAWHPNGGQSFVKSHTLGKRDVSSESESTPASNVMESKPNMESKKAIKASVKKKSVDEMMPKSKQIHIQGMQTMLDSNNLNLLDGFDLGLDGLSLSVGDNIRINDRGIFIGSSTQSATNANNVDDDILPGMDNNFGLFFPSIGNLGHGIESKTVQRRQHSVSQQIQTAGENIQSTGLEEHNFNKKAFTVNHKTGKSFGEANQHNFELGIDYRFDVNADGGSESNGVQHRGNIVVNENLDHGPIEPPIFQSKAQNTENINTSEIMHVTNQNPIDLPPIHIIEHIENPHVQGNMFPESKHNPSDNIPSSKSASLILDHNMKDSNNNPITHTVDRKFLTENFPKFDNGLVIINHGNNPIFGHGLRSTPHHERSTLFHDKDQLLAISEIQGPVSRISVDPGKGHLGIPVQDLGIRYQVNTGANQAMNNGNQITSVSENRVPVTVYEGIHSKSHIIPNSLPGQEFSHIVLQPVHITNHGAFSPTITPHNVNPHGFEPNNDHITKDRLLQRIPHTLFHDTKMNRPDNQKDHMIFGPAIIHPDPRGGGLHVHTEEHIDDHSRHMFQNSFRRGSPIASLRSLHNSNPNIRGSNIVRKVMSSSKPYIPTYRDTIIHPNSIFRYNHGWK